MGSSLQEVAEYVRGLFSFWNLADSLRQRKIYGMGREEHLYFEPGQIMLTAITTRNHQRRMNSHAILLIAINPAHREVLLWDPNLPERLIKTHYQERLEQYSGLGVYLLDAQMTATYSESGGIRFSNGIVFERSPSIILTPEAQERMRR